MRYIRRGGIGILLAFLVSVSSANHLERGSTPAQDLYACTSDVCISFEGLVVFKDEGSNVRVLLHSGAPGHRVDIEVMGPGVPHGIDLVRDLDKSTNLILEVVNANSTVDPRRTRWWRESHRPYSMEHLKPTGYEFYMYPRAFGPTLLFAAGEFGRTEKQCIEFFHETGSGVNSPVEVTSKVEAGIDLRSGQSLRISGLKTGPILLPKPAVDKWKITVRNDPDWSSVLSYHFIHYYDGLLMKRGNDIEEVPETEKYNARQATGTPREKKDCVTRAIPERPCIPISYP